MRPSERPLITADAIARRVTELGDAISTDYADRDLVMVVVLKGGLFFAADLARAIRRPMALEYVRARSYDGQRSTGAVEVAVVPERPLAGAHLLVVEDILDTGRTTQTVLDMLADMSPASLALCTLLDKPVRRIVPVSANYVGFTIDDFFVVGYGLDFNERYRELPSIHVLE